MFSGKNGLLVIGGVVLVAILIVAGLVFAHSNNATAQTAPKACGTVIMHGTGSPAFGVQNSSPAQVANCFWQAYQQCQPATMQLTFMGVDAGVRHTFTIQKKGSVCAITDSAQNYNVSVKLTSKPVISTCTGMAMQADGLHITGCGNGNTFIIPTTSSHL
jgi:hypothetical protein